MMEVSVLLLIIATIFISSSRANVARESLDDLISVKSMGMNIHICHFKVSSNLYFVVLIIRRKKQKEDYSIYVSGRIFVSSNRNYIFYQQPII